MKIDLEHVAMGVALLLLGYMAGKRKAMQPTTTSPSAQPQNAAEWWTYSGQW